MRVLFCNPPWHRQPAQNQPGFRGIRAGSRWPHTTPYHGGDLVGNYVPFPFFLATACALALREGLDARVRDSVAMGESYADFFAAVDDFAPDVLVLETATPSVVNDMSIARQLARPGRQIVMTGVHGELEQPEFLRRERAIDYILVGEYERNCVDLMHAIRGGETGARRERLGRIGNLLYRDRDSDGERIVKTPDAILSALDDLPWPEREMLPARNYFDQAGGLERPQMQVTTTRGCPYGCIFCVWPQMVYKGHSYRRRDPTDVVDEIEVNRAKIDYRSFYVDDDTFNIDRRHVLAFARELQARGITDLPWGAMCRADRMDEEVLTELKAAGLHTVKYGVESADQGVLDAIDKRMCIEQVIKQVELTKALGIRVHLTFTVGHPSDTAQSIERTIDLATRLPADSVQFSIATPFPGTKMYDHFVRQGWLAPGESGSDWERFDGSGKAVARTGTLTQDQLEAYVRRGYRDRLVARVREQILESAAFRAALGARMSQALTPGATVLVLQSAPAELTRALAQVVTEAGYRVRLLAHRRFVSQLDGAACEHVHLFDDTGDFRLEPLRELVEEIRCHHRPAGALIPFNNALGTGYEHVIAVARAAAGAWVFGVSMDGDLRVL